MGIKITVFSGEKIIVGAGATVSRLKPDGSPAFGSDTTSDGHEWEAGCGIETDLDPSVLSDPATLHTTIAGYQKAVSRLMREELIRRGAPPHLITGGNGHQVPPPAPAPAAIAAPAKPAPATWGGPSAAPATTGKPARAAAAPAKPEFNEFEDGQASADDEEDEKPPATPNELLGWARKQPGGDAKNWMISWGMKQKPKHGTLVAKWTPAQVAAAYDAYRKHHANN